MEAVGNRAKIVNDLVASVFSFLEREGYTYASDLEDSEVFSVYLNCKFVNTEKKRKVTIAYTERSLDNVTKYTFSLTITRIPYSDPTQDFFSLDVYLDSHGVNFPTTLVNYFDESQAKDILEKLAGVLSGELFAMVVGEAWMKGYYPKWN